MEDCAERQREVQSRLKYNHMLGGEVIGASFEDQSVTYRYPLSPWEADESGEIRAGILVTIVDSASGTFMGSVCGTGSATAGIDAVPVREAYLGQHIIAEARLIHAGCRLLQASCTLTCEETGETVMESSSLWVRSGREAHGPKAPGNEEGGAE